MTYMHLIITKLSFSWSCKHRGFVHSFHNLCTISSPFAWSHHQVSNLIFFKMFSNKRMGFTMNMHDVAFNFNSPSLVYARCGISNLQVDSDGEQSLEDAMVMRHTYLNCTCKNWKHKELFGSLIITTHHMGFFKVNDSQPIDMNVNQIMWCIIYHNHTCSLKIWALCIRCCKGFITIYHKTNGIATMKEHVEVEHNFDLI